MYNVDKLLIYRADLYRVIYVLDDLFELLVVSTNESLTVISDTLTDSCCNLIPSYDTSVTL